MVRYLIQRPVAVLMIFTVLLITGLLIIPKVPVSLLPDIDVPQIIIKVNYPNTTSSVIEQNIIAPIREGIGNTSHLKSIESKSANHTGMLQLTFDYGTKMDMAYIEVNEKIDKLTSSMPRDMQRPQVIRVNTSDIPIIRIQIIPKDSTRYFEVSKLTEKILKRRIEQIDGVSIVDINGASAQTIAITPDKEALAALNLNENAITYAIQNANRDLGGLNVKDGQYRYFVKVINILEDEDAIASLPVIGRDGSIIPISRIASVKLETPTPGGYHLYNGKQGMVMTVQKQSHSRMNDLVPRIETAITQFKNDYPQIDIALSQDQTFLLDAGISNLEQDLLYGGILTILLLFAFLGNLASPILMSISIPLSLIITFIFFYLFNISFNIISLSGLALGVGMLIDNSIVVIDNITRKRSTGISMIKSSVQGTNEVIAPVISQVLTTIAVYIPLVLLNGMAGALVFDQAIGLTICLCVSLLVSFILTPLLYKIFLKTSPDKLKEDTVFYKWVAKGYHRMISHILKHKLSYTLITVMVMPIGILIAFFLPVNALPKIEKKESLVRLDWNAPIDVTENYNRVRELLKDIPKNYTTAEAEIGIKQFLLQQDNSTVQKAEIYFDCTNEASKVTTDKAVKEWLKTRYPQTNVEIIDAPNAFTQLFSQEQPYLEVRFKPMKQVASEKSWTRLLTQLNQLSNPGYTLGMGFVQEPNVAVLPDYDKMNVYGISRNALEDVLQQQFGVYNVSEIKRYGEIQTVQLTTDRTTIDAKLMATVSGNTGNKIPLHQLVTLANAEQPKFITADRGGPYRSITFDANIKNVDLLKNKISKFAIDQGFTVDFSGKYFENSAQLHQLGLIFLLVLVLLYFILAIHYESLIQPLIVMLTIPLGLSGGMFLLWVTGGTLDVMAAIGFIVILGLIVDDPILKIETLNRLEKKYRAEGRADSQQLLERMIHEAGDICLKPLLLVSLTTSIALVPVLFVSGIGNDLQKPLSIVIIGGLTIGTFFTTWFIPLAYWYVAKWQKRIR